MPVSAGKSQRPHPALPAPPHAAVLAHRVVVRAVRRCRRRGGGCLPCGAVRRGRRGRRGSSGSRAPRPAPRSAAVRNTSAPPRGTAPAGPRRPPAPSPHPAPAAAAAAVRAGGAPGGAGRSGGSGGAERLAEDRTGPASAAQPRPRHRPPPPGAPTGSGREGRGRAKGHGAAWYRTVRLGTVLHGMVRLGMARYGLAGFGTAQLGTARLSTARQGMTWHSTAWHGMARLGIAGHGTAQLGTARPIQAVRMQDQDAGLCAGSVTGCRVQVQGTQQGAACGVQGTRQGAAAHAGSRVKAARGRSCCRAQSMWLSAGCGCPQGEGYRACDGVQHAVPRVSAGGWVWDSAGGHPPQETRLWLPRGVKHLAPRCPSHRTHVPRVGQADVGTRCCQGQEDIRGNTAMSSHMPALLDSAALGSQWRKRARQGQGHPLEGRTRAQDAADHFAHGQEQQETAER